METVRSRLGANKVSQRRLCRVLGQSRSTHRYRRRKPDDDRRLIDELRRWCEWYPRFGSERVHQLVLGTGWRVNFKRVHRLWKQEHLQVPVKQRKRRRLPGQSENGCVRHRAAHRNHVWSYDFLVDRTEDGRQLKLLVVIDEFTRECLATEVGRTFTARDVRLTLQYLFAVRAPRNTSAATTVRSSLRRSCNAGWHRRPCGRFTSGKPVLGKTATWRVLTASYGTNY